MLKTPMHISTKTDRAKIETSRLVILNKNSAKEESQDLVISH